MQKIQELVATEKNQQGKELILVQVLNLINEALKAAMQASIICTEDRTSDVMYEASKHALMYKISPDTFVQALANHI